MYLNIKQKLNFVWFPTHVWYESKNIFLEIFISEDILSFWVQNNKSLNMLKISASQHLLLGITNLSNKYLKFSNNNKQIKTW